MTTDIAPDKIQIVAAEDLSPPAKQYHLATLDGTLAQAATYKKAAGLIYNGSVSSGFTSVAYNGVAKAAMGGAVTTPGWPLKAANSGWLIAAASGDMTIGRLFDAAAASGDIATVMVDVKNLGQWGG